MAQKLASAEVRIARATASLCRSYLAATETVPSELVPADGSAAAAELTAKNTSTREEARAYWSGAAYQMGNLQLMAVRDQLLGFTELLTKGKAILPLFTIARSSVEASARASWLLDPRITRDDRPIRGLAEALVNWKEERDLPPTIAPTDRQSSIDRAVSDAGLLAAVLSKPKKSKSGLSPVPLVLGPQERPGATSIISGHLAVISARFGTGFMGFWSAATHSTIYGIGQHLSEDPSGFGVKLTRDSTPIVTSAAAVCLGLVIAHTNQLVCLGADVSKWREFTSGVDRKWTDLLARAAPT